MMHRRDWIRMSVVVVSLAALAIVGIPAFESHGGGKEPPTGGVRVTGPSLKGIIAMEDNPSVPDEPYFRFVGECNPGPGVNNNMPVVVSFTGEIYDLSSSGATFDQLTAASLENQTLPASLFPNALFCNPNATELIISGVNIFYRNARNIFADVLVKFVEPSK